MSIKNSSNIIQEKGIYIHPTARIEEAVIIGDHTQIWDHVHIRKNTQIGHDVIIGEKSTIAYDVTIGNFVKINAMVYICTGVKIEDQCMISAGVVFTNDRFPRATNRELTHLEVSEPTQETLDTIVRQGATIGANATIGPGIEIKCYAMIGMGSVVTTDIPTQALVHGNPAKLAGYVCLCGPKIVDLKSPPKKEEIIACKRCSRRYIWLENGLKLV